MPYRDVRSTPKFSYKVSARGPVCLVACRDASLALMITRALEDQHYPLVLVPSALGFEQPLLLQPDVVILDELMVQELETVGNRHIMRYLSDRPVVLLGALAAEGLGHEWLQPLVTLPLAVSSTEIMQTVYTLAQAEPAEGRQVPAPTHGHDFFLTLPVPAVS